MELFRVGGDVPDTNYLFMGIVFYPVLPSFLPQNSNADCQAILSIEVSTR